jgi:surfeit locus 1 family protein
MLFLRLFTRRWILLTLLSLVAIGVTIRLGIWQLDRLAQRREFNARVINQIESPQFDLSGEVISEDLEKMEYRHVIVRGEYDHSQEIAIRNQAWRGQYGVHMLTPLRTIDSDQVILVNRGWIPAEDFTSGDWSKYEESGLVEIEGVIRLAQTEPDFGRIADPIPSQGERLAAWNLVNVEAIEEQMPYHLMPVYIQQSPDKAWTQMPYRSEPDIDLTEGSHMSYALQWFTFAAIIAIGTLLYVRREEMKLSSEEVDSGGHVHTRGLTQNP